MLKNWVYSGVFYVEEQNVQISVTCANLKPYFRLLTENQFKKHTDFETR